jgi:hypothetical protein
MKISNLIYSVDDSPIYMAYWPQVHRVNQHFGNHDILYWATATPKGTPFPYPVGDVVRVECGEDVLGPIKKDPTQGGMVNHDMWSTPPRLIRFLAAAILPGVNYVSDMDVLPIKNHIPELESRLTNADILLSCANPARFGAHGAVLSSQLLRNIYTNAGVPCSLDHPESFIKGILALPRPPKTPNWCMDEIALTYAIPLYETSHAINIDSYGVLYDLHQSGDPGFIPVGLNSELNEGRRKLLASDSLFNQIQEILYAEDSPWKEIHIHMDEEGIFTKRVADAACGI